MIIDIFLLYLAFFSKIGKINAGISVEAKDSEEAVFAFRREQSGIVHVRTDGKRILVFTHSGKKSLKEAYVLRFSNGNNEFIEPDVI